jgi:hypothetical protein
MLPRGRTHPRLAASPCKKTKFSSSSGSRSVFALCMGIACWGEHTHPIRSLASSTATVWPASFILAPHKRPLKPAPTTRTSTNAGHVLPEDDAAASPEAACTPDAAANIDMAGVRRRKRRTILLENHVLTEPPVCLHLHPLQSWRAGVRSMTLSVPLKKKLGCAPSSSSVARR